MHEIIDVVALVVATLGLIPLWREKGRRFFAIALTCLVLLGAAYLGWVRYRERQEEEENSAKVRLKEKQLVTFLCEGDKSYEEIYTKLNLGFSDKILNDAIDDLTETQQLVTTSWVSIPAPNLPKRTLNLRFFHLTNRSECTGLQR